MPRIIKACGIGWLVAIALFTSSFAQQPAKPLTNADVIKMVKGGLPESVVVNAIQSHQHKFDISPAGLIALKKAGITSAEMDAIVAAPSGASTAPSPAAATSNPASPSQGSSKSRLPVVLLVSGGSSQLLALEKTQLAQTKTKPTSLKSLAGDSAVAQAMQVGIGTATASAAMHINSPVGGSTIQQAGGIFSGMMSHRAPTVTYVWGVPNPASANVVQTVSPSFSVDFSRTPGVNADDYAPAIVKLTPAQNTCRLVGATQGKAEASASPAADWEVYSHFLEERVPAKVEKQGKGKYKITPAAELSFGEYGVVLRPLAKAKKFAGGDVARAQGDGLVFDAIWTFQVSEDAE